MLFQGYRAKRVKHHRGYARGFLLVLALFLTVSNAVADDITGTIYQADGITNLVGESVVVAAYTGDPCGALTEVASTTSSAVDGSYTIAIAAGDYFVRTSNLNAVNYLDEWYASASSQIDCEGAQSVTVPVGAPATGIDFQLDAGVTISGTVRDAGGTPITGDSVEVRVIDGGRCSVFTEAVTTTNPLDGTFSVTGLPPDTYYLVTNADAGLNLLNEWWASGGSVIDCMSAQAITAAGGESFAGIDFQLDAAATIAGTLYENDGVTEITGVELEVEVYKGSCWGEYAGYATSDAETGAYSIGGLYPGDYCLAVNNRDLNYEREWWASPNSVKWPSDAQLVAVAGGDLVSGIDFQLGAGGTISGTVLDSTGTTAITGYSILIRAYASDPCGDTENKAEEVWANAGDGTFTLSGLPAGSYFLLARAQSAGAPFTDEWWASPASVSFCKNAQPITLAAGGSVGGIDFMLDADADYDNMADTWEMGVWGNLDQDRWDDADGDSLNNGDEYDNGIDPTTPDSDGDLIADAYELYNAGTDPGDPGSTPELPIHVSVMHRHEPDDSYVTVLALEIDPAFVGTPMPGVIDSISVIGPSGDLGVSLGDFSYDDTWREFSMTLPVVPELGTYTFTVTGGGLSGTATDVQTVIRQIPLPDPAARLPADGATITSKTPVFSWDPVTYEGVTLYYRLEITDMAGDRVWASSRRSGMTSCGVPYNRLTPGTTYRWRLRVTDSDDYYAVQNRANSAYQTFTMGDVGTLQHSAMPAIDIDGYGAALYYTTAFNGVDMYLNVIDHDGVAYDGSSHGVEAILPGGTRITMDFSAMQSATVGEYSYWFDPGSWIDPGSYPITFEVTDPDGNVAQFVDTLEVPVLLDPPDQTSFTPSNSNPVAEAVTATFDNVYVNGVLHENFDVASFMDLDFTKWDEIDEEHVTVAANALKMTLGDCIGSCGASMQFKDSNAIDAIRADIAVESASSDVPSAGIEGLFYNNGSNDVFARLAIKGGAVVYGIHEVVIGGGLISLNTLEEGTLMAYAGGAVTVSIVWDGSDLTFGADDNTHVHTPAVALPVVNARGINKKLELGMRLVTADTTPTFSWDPVTGANQYRVRIYDSENNATVWRGWAGNQTTHTVPPGVLQPNTIYHYRVDARDAHSPLDIDFNAKAPSSNQDNFEFWTGNEDDFPFVDFDSTGVHVSNNAFTGPYLNFWILVHDAQGVPGNIESVTVTFPNGTDEEVLYEDVQFSSTPTSGYYQTSSFLPIEEGTYTFTVTDRDGNVTTRTEDLVSNPIGYPDAGTMTPAGCTLVGDTGVFFDWDDVAGAAFYRLEIYDLNYRRLYRLATTESQYDLPPGFLKENETYRYRIATRREFFSQNVDNDSRSPWDYYGMFTFKTTEAVGGSAPPGIVADDRGVAVVHFSKPGTGEDNYWLTFSVDVSDLDGVPANIQSVVVTYPDSSTRELYLDSVTSATEASYWAEQDYGNSTAGIQEGTYIIRVTDTDGNWAEVTDNLIVDVMPLPENVTPSQDAVVSGTTPTIDWNDVPGADKYKVRIYDAAGTIHWSDYQVLSSYTVPGGVLALDRTYSFRVYAYREDSAEAPDIDNWSLDQLWSSERHHFTTEFSPNAPPVAAADNFTVSEGDVDNLLDLTVNDSDPDGSLDLASIVIVLQPSYGSLVVNGDGTVYYTHDGSETTADSFSYTIADDLGDRSNEALVSLTIIPQNDAPVVGDIPDQNVDEGQTFAVINLDDYVSDADHTDAEMTWSYSGNAALTVDITNRVATIGIPDADWNGSETITFTATDPDLDFSSDAAVFTVNAVNDPPVAGNDSFTVDEGSTTPLNLVLNDSDVDGSLDLTAIAITILPNSGTLQDNGDGTVTYVHDGSETTADSFTYTIDDNQGAVSNEATVVVTIIPQNDPPVVGDIPGQTIAEGGVFATITLDDYVSDADNADNQLTWTYAGNIELTVDIVNRVATITAPSADWNGEETITFRATDPGDLYAEDAAVFRVVADNDPPVAVDDEFTIFEGSASIFDLAGNDSDVDDGLDPASIVIVSGPANGSIADNGDGTVGYTHDGSENPTDGFTYTIRDLAGLTSNQATVSIVVLPVNDAPIANDDSLSFNEGATTNLNLAANDSDADDGLDLASIVITTDPAYGTIAVNIDGTVNYTHDGSENLSDGFTYVIADQSGTASNEATVTLTGTGVNDPPVANDDSFTVNEGATASLDLAANDTDADDGLDPASIVIVSGPSYGSVVDNGDGTVDYTHDGSETTADSFTYTIEDNGGLPSNEATVTLTITPQNDAPVAVGDSLTVDEGATGSVDLAANDTDADDGLDPASIVIVSGPTYGSVVDNGDGTVDYTHDGSETTADSFTYTIQDNSAATSNVTTVSVSVTPVNDAPQANNDGLTTDEDTSSGGLLTAADAENDSLTFSIDTNGTKGTAVIVDDATGAYTYTPLADANGADAFTFRVFDGQANSNVATVTVFINAVNDAPVASSGVLATDEDVPAAGTLFASDVDQDALSYQIVANGSLGLATITDPGSGAYSYAPFPNANGSDSFTFRVSDGQAVSNTVTVTVDVYPVNDPPDMPLAEAPGENETLAYGEVVLASTAFSDIDGDSVGRVLWRVRRIDQIARIIDEVSTGSDISSVGTNIEGTLSALDEGMKYAWQVGHEDPDGLITWSPEYSFKVGTSVRDASVTIEPGIEMADFKMVSFVQWPDDPMAEDAFGDAMLENYEHNYRIGTFDPVSGAYVEYGQGLAIEPGRAYWMVARDGFNPANEGVPVNTTFQLYVKLDYDPDSGMGYNMVGCPNGVNYLWEDVMVVEYQPNGDIAFGPEAVKNLAASNDYLDTRLWRWENGTYLADTSVMEAYGGYWVNARRPNVYLMFDVSAQTELTNADVAAAAVRAASSADDHPPLPMAGLGGDDAAAERGGCFIQTARNGAEPQGGWLVPGVLIPTALVLFVIPVVMRARRGHQ